MAKSKAVMKLRLIGALLLATMTANEAGAKVNALEPKGVKQAVTLASGGESRAVLIVPAAATDQETLAAGELAKYLEQMSGAAFSVQKDEQKIAGHYISVGDTLQGRQAGFTQIHDTLGAEGFAINVSDGNVYLLGGPQGIVNAAMAFLEEDLGCRWYSDKWDYIPIAKELIAQVSPRRSMPDFALRSVFSAHAVTNSPEWTRRNRVLKWNHFNHMQDWFCHTYGQICPMSEFAAHPDYFAKRADGTPFNTQLCPTHPEIVKRAKERAMAALQANKRQDVTFLSISECDGSTGYCRCERCEAINTAQQAPISAHLTLVNEVARAIRADYPGIKVDFIVYSKDLRTPPRAMQMESNVALWFCTSNSPRVIGYRHNEAMADFYKWKQLVDTISIWEYGCDYSNYFRVVPSLPALTDNIRLWKENAAAGIMFLEVFGVRGGDQQALRAWVLGKMLWDSTLDPDKLALDFCEGVFGPAALAMYNYYHLVNRAGRAEKSVEDFYGEAEFIKQARAIFDKAFAQADQDGDEELLKRLEVHYVPVAFMEIEAIFRGYPGNRENFPMERYRALLERIQQITAREEMARYSEIRSMSGRLAELGLLLHAADDGVLGIEAIDGTLYEYPVREDALARRGKAVCLPCNDNWLLQWHFPVNVCVPGQAYQLRAQLRVEKEADEGKAGTAGVYFPQNKEKSFSQSIESGLLYQKEYCWIEIGQPFVPEEKNYVWFAAAAGSAIGHLYVDRIELIPVEK